MAQRLSLRFNSIVAKLYAHVADPAEGHNVPDTIEACSMLIVTVCQVVKFYHQADALSPANQAGLATLLGNVLSWIARSRTDVYEGSHSARPAYASYTTLIPYQAFSHARPSDIIGTLISLPDEFIRENHILTGMYALLGAAYEENPSEQWTQALRLLYERMWRH